MPARPLCLWREYWSGQPLPSPGDLPNPGIKRRSPALQADSLPAEPPVRGKGKGEKQAPQLLRPVLSRRESFMCALWGLGPCQSETSEVMRSFGCRKNTRICGVLGCHTSSQKALLLYRSSAQLVISFLWRIAH